MDGFKKNSDVIVIGATNQINSLDEALLRPGRFDLILEIPKPSFAGIKQLFTHYMGKYRREESLDNLGDGELQKYRGLTGAEIKNLINQASIIALKRNGDKITRGDLDTSYLNITQGLRSK